MMVSKGGGVRLSSDGKMAGEGLEDRGYRPKSQRVSGGTPAGSGDGGGI